MARRGLVSKSMGGPQQGGNSALMPKGEKPKGPELLPVAEVARRLRVDSSHVETWMQKGQLRGGDAGIRPYDFKKFQLDYAEEIKLARKQAVAEKQTKSDRKPKKGFFSKFTSIFGGGGEEKGDDSGAASKKLVQENKKLKQELQKLKKGKSSGSDGGDRDLEEKIRYLEKQASESRALEVEVARLKRQLKEQPGAGDSSGADAQLRQELEQAKAQLQEAHQLAEEGQQLREALRSAEEERVRLQSAVQELQSRPVESAAPGPETEELQMALNQKERAFAQLQAHAQQMAQENAKLKEAQASQTSAPAAEPVPVENPLTKELLELQRINLGRFQRLKNLYEESLQQMEESHRTPTSVDPELVAEFKLLKGKYDKLLAQSNETDPAQEEVLEQLSQTRATVSKLKEENEKLQAQLSSNSNDTSKIKELEEKLREAQSNSGSSKLLETELDALRKAMEVKENQVQKVASRLADNEKRLSKAMQESARLTELLIERENRLRELSTEFEQEYRDKMENLDRQVSGLQWKLSLREERIAHLESELLSKGE